MIPRRIAIAAVAGLAALGSCSRSRLSGQGRSMNVLLVVVDTERADHVSAYGYSRKTTPAADSLAEHGALFLDATVQASFSQGSYASMFTGLYPQSHGVRDHPSILGLELDTLAESLKAAGYRTAGFHSHNLLALPEWGYAQGMDTYRFTPSATHTVNAALDWISKQSENRWFLFVQFMEPHAPYEPPAPFNTAFGARPDGFLAGRSRGSGEPYPASWMFDFESQGIPPQDLEYLKSLYDGEIAYADSELGRLMAGIDRLGLRDRTLVVYTADHGEAFGEHGVYFNHDATLYQEVLRVPLIVSNPRIFPQRISVEDPAREIDLMPTVLDLVNLPIPRAVEGESLLSLVAGKHEDRWSFAESRPLEPSRTGLKNYKTTVPGEEGKWRSAKGDGFKLIRIPVAIGNEVELYDLGEDPGERHNIWATNRATRTKLGTELDHFRKRARVIESRKTRMTKEVWEQLKALGYTGSPSPGSSPSSPPPSAKEGEPDDRR